MRDAEAVRGRIRNPPDRGDHPPERREWFTFYLNYRLIADEGATTAATVGYLLPVVSVALGAIVLGEDLNARIIAGMIVVLAGVGMTRKQRKPGGELAPVPAS